MKFETNRPLFFFFTILISLATSCQVHNAFIGKKNNSPDAPIHASSDDTPSNSPHETPTLPYDKETFANDIIDVNLLPFLNNFKSPASASNPQLSQSIRSELMTKGVVAIPQSEFSQPSQEKVALGRLLFYDRILSGNMTVSCASCHVVWRGLSDGTSLMNDIGYKGIFSRIDNPQTINFLPRNTPSIFNHGHKSFSSLFWDGRIEKDPSLPSGISSPVQAKLPQGLDSILAAQALFPLIAPSEMLGRSQDNALAAQGDNPQLVWSMIMARITKNNEYLTLLKAAYPGTPDSGFQIQHVGNAIAAFEEQMFRADESPFDAFLKGNDNALTTTALQGAQIFYGKAKCGTCHAGNLQTDQGFHAISVPQFGIGKNQGVNGFEDFGRGGITGKSQDRYKFKTPSLRNVFITGPWGHDGAFTNLRTYIEHYGSPATSFANWYPGQIILRSSKWPPGLFDPFFNTAVRQNILGANEFSGVQLSSQEVDWILEFLGTLTDRSFLNRDVVPANVPSGLNDFLGVYGLRSDWFDQLRPLPWL